MIRGPGSVQLVTYNVTGMKHSKVQKVFTELPYARHSSPQRGREVGPASSSRVRTESANRLINTNRFHMGPSGLSRY